MEYTFNSIHDFRCIGHLVYRYSSNCRGYDNPGCGFVRTGSGEVLNSLCGFVRIASVEDFISVCSFMWTESGENLISVCGSVRAGSGEDFTWVCGIVRTESGEDFISVCVFDWTRGSEDFSLVYNTIWSGIAVDFISLCGVEWAYYGMDSNRMVDAQWSRDTQEHVAQSGDIFAIYNPAYSRSLLNDCRNPMKDTLYHHVHAQQHENVHLSDHESYVFEMVIPVSFLNFWDFIDETMNYILIRHGIPLTKCITSRLGIYLTNVFDTIRNFNLLCQWYSVQARVNIETLTMSSDFGRHFDSVI